MLTEAVAVIECSKRNCKDCSIFGAPIRARFLEGVRKEARFNVTALRHDFVSSFEAYANCLSTRIVSYRGFPRIVAHALSSFSSFLKGLYCTKGRFQRVVYEDQGELLLT